MKHDEVKARLLNDPATMAEYERLEPLYELQRQIIALRKEKRLSQVELARLLGTGQSAISRLEQGNYNPSLALLNRLANVMGKKLHIHFR